VNVVTYIENCVMVPDVKPTIFTRYLIHIKMGNLLYIIAVILIIGWLIGLVGFQASGFIHVLLVIAIIAVIIRVIQGRKAL
jgi:hypothetical protein